MIEGIPFEGRERDPGWLERRTSMTELRQRIIADMASAGLAPSIKEAFAVLQRTIGARPIG